MNNYLSIHLLSSFLNENASTFVISLHYTELKESMRHIYKCIMAISHKQVLLGGNNIEYSASQLSNSYLEKSIWNISTAPQAVAASFLHIDCNNRHPTA